MNEKLAITLAKRQGWAKVGKRTLQTHLNAELDRMMRGGVVWVTLHVRHKGRKVRRRVSLSRYTQMLAQEIESRVTRTSTIDAYLRAIFDGYPVWINKSASSDLWNLVINES